MTATPPDSPVDRLAALAIFGSVPRSELEWLAANGELRTAEAGTVFADAGNAIDEMFILLAGRLSLYVPKGGVSRKLVDAVAGQILGTIPYSRFQRSPGTVVVEETTTAFVLHQRHFLAMIREAHELTTAVVHYMLDRAREFRTVQLNDDRLSR